MTEGTEAGDGDGGSAERDRAELAKLGYAQQLLREMGGFHNFALSFSIISVLTGAITLYGHGLTHGGPLVMTIGWPLVALGTMTVALARAELASAYPTAGALYHWSAILGGNGWGFATAWLNTLGQFAITAGIDYGLALFVVDTLGLEPSRLQILGVYGAILTSHAILNHVGVRAVAVLNWLSAWYHIIGVALLVVALLWRAPMASPGFLMRRYSADGEHTYWYAFAIGLLQAQWTFTGYDASAHTTEETRDPSRNAPWGIVLSVAVSAVVGWIMLLVITLAIQDLPATAAAGNPFIQVLTTGLGETLGRWMVWMVMVAMWFCGLSSVTSNSRMLFAFARDGGLPASKLLARVSPRFQSPHVAVWVSAVAAFAVALWARAYAAMVALSTLALYASYALPVLAALRDGKLVRRGPWQLGRWTVAVRVLAVAWVAIVTVLFVLPPNQLAGYTFAGSVLAIALYWFAWMKPRFQGPPRLPPL